MSDIKTQHFTEKIMALNISPSDITGLEAAIGYKFKNFNIIREALTHSSYSNEVRAHDIAMPCNERMEFLGDSVLSIITSELLFLEHPELPEGDLSKIRAGTVNEKALSKFAKSIDLGKYLYLGRGEDLTHGRTRPSILADAFEALLAAIYLDSGIDEVKRFLLPYIVPEIKALIESGSFRDYKTMLQQIVQQEQGEILEYVVVAESGPPHMRVFEIEAHLNSNVIGRGTGHSKREAEQQAAREALKLFGEA